MKFYLKALERTSRPLGVFDAEREKTLLSNFPKKCSCGRTYTPETWKQLPNPKSWKLPWREEQELRDCACGSTIAVLLVVGDPE